MRLWASKVFLNPYCRHPPFWDTVPSPPTPIKKNKQKQTKPNDQNEMFCFQHVTPSSVLCSVLTQHDGVQHKAGGQGKMPSSHSENEYDNHPPHPTPPHPTPPHRANQLLWCWCPPGNNLELLRFSFPGKTFYGKCITFLRKFLSCSEH